MIGGSEIGSRLARRDRGEITDIRETNKLREISGTRVELVKRSGNEGVGERYGAGWYLANPRE